MSGGGSLGAVEAGIASKLNDELGRKWDLITGVSAGGINAAWMSMFAKGDEKAALDQLKQFYVQTKSSDIYLPQLNIFNYKSLLSTAPLKKLVSGLVQGKTPQRAVLIGTSSLGLANTLLVDEAMLATDPVSYIMATSAIPLLFPPIVINDTAYADGGLLNNELISEGVARCPLDADVEVDLTLCVPYVGPKNGSASWGIVDLVIRDLSMGLMSALANHALDDRCQAGVTSRVLVHVYQVNLLMDLAVLDFDFGADLWKMGYSMQKKEDFYLCGNEASDVLARLGRRSAAESKLLGGRGARRV